MALIVINGQRFTVPDEVRDDYVQAEDEAVEDGVESEADPADDPETDED